MKLSKSLREEIARKAIAATFDKEQDSITKAEHNLGMKAYKHLFAANIKHIAAIPNNWFRRCHCLRFNVGGQRHDLRVIDEVATPYGDNYGCQLLGVIDGELGEAIQAHANVKADFNERRNTAHTRLSSTLKSINSLRQLTEQWPEGKPFYEKLFGMDKTGKAVAIRFDDINALLSIKTAKT